MDELERKLFDLPKQKLGLKADWKIKLKLYNFIIARKITAFEHVFFLKSPAFKAGFATLLIAIISLSGTSIYAYFSAKIAPGHSLYNLKQGLEVIEEKLTITPVSKVEMYDKFSQRRLEEALHLSTHDRQEESLAENEKIDKIIGKTIDNAMVDFNAAVSSSQEIANKDIGKDGAEKNGFLINEDKKIEYLNEIEKNAQERKNGSLAKKASEAKKVIVEFGKARDKTGEEQQEDKSASIGKTATSSGQKDDFSTENKSDKEKKAEQPKGSSSTKNKGKKESEKEKYEAPKNISCTKEYVPVCGTDGKTYANACLAKADGAKAAYSGSCQKKNNAQNSLPTNGNEDKKDDEDDDREENRTQTIATTTSGKIPNIVATATSTVSSGTSTSTTFYNEEGGDNQQNGSDERNSYERDDDSDGEKDQSDDDDDRDDEHGDD